MNIVELFEKLSLDTNTRLERAKSLGFDTSKIWYHGTKTPINFTKFKIGKDGYNELGIGVYLSSDNNHSSYYSRGENGRVIPCYIRKGDIFDYAKFMDKQTNSHEKIKNEVFRRFNQITGKNREEFDAIIAPMIHHGIRIKLFDNIVKLCGYIGAVNSESQVPSQIVIFDPKNIRSIFAKFNPAISNSDNLLA